MPAILFSLHKDVVFSTGASEVNLKVFWIKNYFQLFLLFSESKWSDCNITTLVRNALFCVCHPYRVLRQFGAGGGQDRHLKSNKVKVNLIRFWIYKEMNIISRKALATKCILFVVSN